MKLISDYCKFHAEANPAADAFVIGESCTSYAQFELEIDACAKALIALGVKRGDRVATLCPPHPDFLTIFLATSSIGGIWLGLNPRYQLDELMYVVEDAQPSVLLARPRIGRRCYESELSSLQQKCESLQATILLGAGLTLDGCETYTNFLEKGNAVSDADLAERRADTRSTDAALIVYTSGSTGKPKGAVISHHALIKCSKTQLQFWPASPIRIVNFLPINHIGCVGDISCYALVGGGTTIFMEQFDPEACLAIMQSNKVTVWGGVPTTLQLCVNHSGFSNYDLSCVQIIFWSGAAASASLVASLSAVTPNLSTSYGMTETVGSVTFTDICNNIDVLANTIGKPASQYELRLVGEDGVMVDSGSPGELQIRGDFIMKEYWNQPGATAETIDADGWLSTGDLAQFRSDGNIKLVGRLKEMFKSGGYNIYPREIEKTIESHEQVAIAAVVGMADALYHEVGVAFVVPVPGSELSEKDLKSFCGHYLANYKIPKKFIFRKTLPTLSIGKIDKKALSEWASASLTSIQQIP